MSESTLSLKTSEIAGEVGFFLGWGRGADNGDAAWSDQKKREIAAILKDGLAQFYTPPQTSLSPFGYEWSFLRPTGSVTMTQSVATVDLPDDFASMQGQLSVGASGQTGFGPVDIVNEGLIRQRYAEVPSDTGRPRFAAVRPLKGTGLNEGQRFDLYVWPLPDQAYTLTFRYILLPNAMTSVRPYAYGGAQHAATIKASCVAIAERNRDNAKGVMWDFWIERLTASIAADQRNKAEKIGYNGDRSDMTRPRSNLRHFDGSPVTWNGVEYH